MINELLRKIEREPLEFEEPRAWQKLREWARNRKIPLVRRDTGRFLYKALRVLKPRSVLEIGSGSGYSTLWMLRAIQDNGSDSSILAMERDNNRFLHCRQFFSDYPNVEMIKIDALRAFQEDETTKKWHGYDFVFLDAIKRDYVEYLRELSQRIRPGGVLIADNVSFGGRVSLPDDQISDKHIGGVRKMREFLRELRGSPYFESKILDIDDGLSVSVRREYDDA